jgi:hypothetical protein
MRCKVDEDRMKQPDKADFEVHDEGSTIVVTFNPTRIYFTYARLLKPEWDKQRKNIEFAEG